MMRASAGRSASVQPHVAVERAQPQQAVRAEPRLVSVTEPMPASSRSVPDTFLPSIGPRRISAVSVPLKPLDGDAPFEHLNAIDQRASRGTRTVDIGAQRRVGACRRSAARAR